MAATDGHVSSGQVGRVQELSNGDGRCVEDSKGEAEESKDAHARLYRRYFVQRRAGGEFLKTAKLIL